MTDVTQILADQAERRAPGGERKRAFIAQVLQERSMVAHLLIQQVVAAREQFEV